LTLEAIAADPWNAVELPLPADADKELLIAARSAAEYCADGHHELMMKAIAGEYTPPNWTGVGDGTEPDVHEYDEGKWLQADARLNLIDERLEQFEERAPDAATQQANDESAKRQDAERAARSGESVSPENSASGSDYVRDLISRAQEAKAERESEGAENVVLEHGEGQTPGGGGGRGIF
jgi:hypothetical protein